MQRRTFLKQALLLSAAGLAVSPFKALGSNPGKKPVEGMISSRGNPLAGVSVSDGYSVVQSNKDGRYTLPFHADAEFVFVSTPAGYAFNASDNLAGTFLRQKQQDTYNFELTPLDRSDEKHRFLVWADPQIQNTSDARQLFSESIPDLQEHIKGWKMDLLHGMAVGDLIWDKKEMWPEYKRAVGQTGIPFFQVLGNHDEDYDMGGDPESDQTFKQHFGPTYYSYNRGKAHYIVLDDVRYLGPGKKYDGYLVKQQLDWLKEDLKYVEKDKLIFIALHIPVYNTVKNNQALYALLKDFRQVHILSGHTHTNKNHIENNIYEHVHGTLCGAWWTGPICKDGTPRGYGIYEVEGTEVSWYYKAISKASDYQFRVHTEQLSQGRIRILANVWNYDPEWKVEWWENGRYRGEMEQTKGYDPLSVQLYKGKTLPKGRRQWIEPGKTDHLFMAHSDAGTRIKIRVTDRFGNRYKEKFRV